MKFEPEKELLPKTAYFFILGKSINKTFKTAKLRDNLVSPKFKKFDEQPQVNGGPFLHVFSTNPPLGNRRAGLPWKFKR